MNHSGTGVTQYCELPVDNFVPNQERVLAIIHTDSQHACVQRIELLSVLRELAQLPCTIGSPIAPVEDEEHTFTAQGIEVKTASVLIV